MKSIARRREGMTAGNGGAIAAFRLEGRFARRCPVFLPCGCGAGGKAPGVAGGEVFAGFVGRGGEWRGFGGRFLGLGFRGLRSFDPAFSSTGVFAAASLGGGIGGGLGATTVTIAPQAGQGSVVPI